MGLFIVLGLVFAVITTGVLSYTLRHDKDLAVLAILMIVCLACPIASFILSGIFSPILGGQVEYIVTERYQLASIRDNSISGSFFLGSGTVNGVLQYQYYIKDESGALYLQSRNVNNYEGSGKPWTFVSEEDRTDGVLEKIRISYVNKDLNKWFWHLGGKEDLKEKDVFRVPKGTVYKTFSLNK
jgi:hypothetical protein